jgi:transposase
MGCITARKRGSQTYYVYQESRRVKIDRNAQGKNRGSGKSLVRTKAVYLGSAEKICKLIQDTKTPQSVNVRPFGLVAAAYQTAREIRLPEILMEHLPGERAGIPRWSYFFVSILNRLDQATSKNRMAEWLAKSILPDLLGINPHKLTGKNFWYAADDILSEKLLREKRAAGAASDDLFAGLSEDAFNRVEADLFASVDKLMGLSPSVICYDTTNFYTYIEEPKCSELANTCHSKDSKNHLRHVGLLMATEKSRGVPIVSHVYQANRHDSKVFSCVLADLLTSLTKLCGDARDLVIVLDKGNNSNQNFKAMAGLISWVGALVPSHHKDLIEKDPSSYHGTWNDLQYYRCAKTVMGLPCSVVLTFNGATKRKQEHTLTRNMDKLKQDILAKWSAYKKRPDALPKGITTLLKRSEYGACLQVSFEDGSLKIEENHEEVTARKQRFGKSIIFSNMLNAETVYLIETYHQRASIEEDFQLLKDHDIIRLRPIRHWTDTKIRSYAFCCVVALTLLRVMQWKVEQAEYRMSPKLLKEELRDITEVVMLYNETEATRTITDRSSVQQKLWQVFQLGEVERLVLLH